MRISARKGTKITENVFELKLTKPRKIILNLVTTVELLEFLFNLYSLPSDFLVHFSRRVAREEKTFSPLYC